MYMMRFWWTCVVGPERWLQRMRYRRLYGDPCGGDALPGGDSNTQYAPYCGNQRPVRLLIAVLLYFLRVQCHEYAAAVMVLSRMYSSTYGLTLTHLSYAANLSGAMIQRAPTHTVLKMHITKISELKLWCNKLSGGGDAYGIAWGKSQLGTWQCGQLESQRLTDWLGQNGPFYRRVWGTVSCMRAVMKMWPPTGVVHGTATVGDECLQGTCHTH